MAVSKGHISYVSHWSGLVVSNWYISYHVSHWSGLICKGSLSMHMDMSISAPVPSTEHTQGEFQHSAHTLQCQWGSKCVYIRLTHAIDIFLGYLFLVWAFCLYYGLSGSLFRISNCRRTFNMCIMHKDHPSCSPLSDKLDFWSITPRTVRCRPSFLWFCKK